jgi:hypothetical protein
MNCFFKQGIALALNLTFFACLATNSIAEEAKNLAQAAVNPLTTTMTVPVQYEYNENIGPTDDGTRSTIFLQPLLPFQLNEDWYLISRTIIPIIEQEDIFPGAGRQSGLGDITQSFFFSPKKPTNIGWSQGAGPVLQIDSATDDYLGLEENGLGLSYIGLNVDGPKLYGFLINHIYSVEGQVGDTYSNTFLQPFFDYTTDGALTIELTSETNYNWKDDKWSIPLTLTASQFFMVGKQPILLGGGFKYWLESAEADPEGLSLNLNLYLLFPK